MGTLVVTTRRDGRAAALLPVFCGVATHQAFVALDPPTGAIVLDAASLQAVALFVTALGGLGGVWAFARIGRERNGAEEMHWDAMETLRAINELSRPGGEGDTLGSLLALGERRFGLSFGAVLPADASEPAIFHAAPGVEIDSEQGIAALQPYTEWRSERPSIDDAPGPTHPLRLTRVFIATMHLSGAAAGNLAFASVEPLSRKLTATDKDLLASLANSAARLVAPPGSAAPSSQSLVDRLRERLAGDPVEFALDPGLGEILAGDPLLEDVAYGLARGARRVSAEGALRVESGNIRATQGESHFITLTVRIEDPALDARALNGVTTTGSASLEALGEQLRAQGGDVSMSVESGVGASMTAFVPVVPASSDSAPPPDLGSRYL